MKRFESGFGSALWRGRLVVLIAVVASFVVALVLFYITSVDVVYTVIGVGGYANPALTMMDRNRVRATIVAHIAGIFDGYLFAAILVIFAIGLYELFIGRLKYDPQAGERVLMVRNLDDLKDSLAKVVFLILIVRYFEFALELPIRSATDLLYLAAGIGLIALAIYLAGRRSNP